MFLNIKDDSRRYNLLKRRIGRTKYKIRLKDKTNDLDQTVYSHQGESIIKRTSTSGKLTHKHSIKTKSLNRMQSLSNISKTWSSALQDNKEKSMSNTDMHFLTEIILMNHLYKYERTIKRNIRVYMKLLLKFYKLNWIPNFAICL